jgi:hypothetical protein
MCQALAAVHGAKNDLPEELRPATEQFIDAAREYLLKTYVRKGGTGENTGLGGPFEIVDYNGTVIAIA